MTAVELSEMVMTLTLFGREPRGIGLHAIVALVLRMDHQNDTRGLGRGWKGICANLGECFFQRRENWEPSQDIRMAGCGCHANPTPFLKYPRQAPELYIELAVPVNAIFCYIPRSLTCIYARSMLLLRQTQPRV